MRYRITEHWTYKLKKPYKRRTGAGSLFQDYQIADERKDGENHLKVNVLIMAKGKKKNNRDSQVTAGELFGKLGRKADSREIPAENDLRETEFLDDTLLPEDDAGFDSIDVSSGKGHRPSDSDLDINELLRKYLPDEDEGNLDDTPAPNSGVLSKLKKTAAETIEADPDLLEDDVLSDDLTDDLLDDDLLAEDDDLPAVNGDAKLLNALDSAFSLGVDDLFTEADAADADDLFEEETPKSGRNARFMAEEEAEMGASDDETIREYDLAEGEDVLPDAETEALFGAEKPKKKSRGFFASLLGRAPKEEPASAVMPEEPEEEALTEDEEMILAHFMNETAEKTEETVDETAEPIEEADDAMPTALSLIGETEDAAESEENGDADEAEDESDDATADPTDMNLMIAFGLDDSKHIKAKELGDLLETKQAGKAKHHKLDREEYVDKTQTPKLRKEFHDREVALWIKLIVCTIFTGILMVFENIDVLTDLFTGASKQWAGVFDPGVYPTVYIMASLQLMLLACVCAFDEIVEGFKAIFRGTPKPESMTALLTVAGIVYSVVLSGLMKAPAEPRMFNFLVALSALMTLIYAIYNCKRERMNFRVVANKKPKHIVRRLLDEESECESKAFADADDVCDVMKIEKTDFVDRFFGRLHAPDSNTGIFMTFVMSATAAIAVLFGIFANLRGGDAAMVCRVIYASLLILAPLSVYMTFSYPFYRANRAAMQYDSAIIGEAALEEYSNASIISFDDKNVFPSYSVKVQNIRIYNNARVDRVLYYAASVFGYVGGPLQDVFEVATRDMGNSDNVQVFDTESGFLATQVDGVNITFGSCDALRARGLDIPDDAAEDDVDLSDELEIMYMFRESKLVSKMYIKYVMDADIDIILKQFSGSGLYVCVRTFDPNIDERMIAKKVNMKRMPLKIVRYGSADEVGSYEAKVDSGLVTCGTPKSLLQVISYCGHVLHAKKTNIALSVLSVMIGFAILVLLLLSDSMHSLNSLFIAIYQLIWLIPMMISAKMTVR